MPVVFLGGLLVAFIGAFPTVIYTGDFPPAFFQTP